MYIFIGAGFLEWRSYNHSFFATASTDIVSSGTGSSVYIFVKHQPWPNFGFAIHHQNRFSA
jgi:hypothetical protein